MVIAEKSRQNNEFQGHIAKNFRNFKNNLSLIWSLNFYDILEFPEYKNALFIFKMQLDKSNDTKFVLLCWKKLEYFQILRKLTISFEFKKRVRIGLATFFEKI